MRKNKILFRASHLIAALLLLANPIFAETPSTAPIRLGATLPLSGDIASYGNLIKDGIELALSDMRARGYEVSMSYQDVPLPGPVAVSAINKLISEDRIQGLAGNFWNPAIPIMAPAIMRSDVVTFHTAAADDLILEAGDYIFSTNTKIKDEAARVAEYAFKDLNARSACVLYIGTNFGENYYKHFTSHFEKLGGKVLYSELTKLGESDLRTVLAKVAASPCDIFFAPYFGTNLGLVLKQASTAGIHKQILAVYEAEDPSVIEVAGRAAEGTRFFVPEPVNDTDAIRNYKERFTKRFGYSPRILGSNAYDAVTILVTALAECSGEPRCAKDKIYKIRDYPGVSGKFSIDEDGAARKDFVLKTIVNGKFERLN